MTQTIQTAEDKMQGSYTRCVACSAPRVTWRCRENCYYHGTVRGDPSSIVGGEPSARGRCLILITVSTCNGLDGLVWVDGERLVILPASRHLTQAAAPYQHV